MKEKLIGNKEIEDGFKMEERSERNIENSVDRRLQR